MKIAVIGGTGKEGSGIAVRWASQGHDVTIGSRDAARAQQRAHEIRDEYQGKITGSLQGGANTEIIPDADLVVLAVPYGAHAATLNELKPLIDGKKFLDITVPLAPPKVREVNVPAGNSAALEAQAILGENTPVAAAFHHVSSQHLLDLEHDIETDVLVVADDVAFRKEIMALVRQTSARPVNAGVLKNAVALEALTSVLIHINGAYKAPGAGIRITGLPE